MQEQHMNYMHVALLAAAESLDPSTQNGAVLWTGDGCVTACNEFPRGVANDPLRWERPQKYSYVEHAERNAIYRAARRGYRTEGAMLFAPWAACADCARAIVCSGITTLVRFGNTNTNERWDDSIRIGDEIMAEGGVKIVELPMTGNHGVTLRRNGERLVF